MSTNEQIDLDDLQSDNEDSSLSSSSDDDKSVELEEDENEDFDLKSVLGQRRKQCWTADEAVTHCSKCNAEFTWLLRRHHCRACGEIFCYKCCSNSDVLPRAVEQFPSKVFTSRHPTPPLPSPSPQTKKEKPQSYVKAAKSTTKMLGKAAYEYYYGKPKEKKKEKQIPRSESSDRLEFDEHESTEPSSPHAKKEKTCNKCHTKLAHAHMVEQYIPKLRQQRIAELVDIVKDVHSEKALQAAAVSLLRSWREIQYALPTQKPTTLETQMLHANATKIADHSCWKVMLAKSAFSSGIDSGEQARILAEVSYIEEEPPVFDTRTSCTTLLCRDQVCRKGWSIEACVTLLCDETFDAAIVFKSATRFLTKESQCTVDLSFFIINLCWAIRYESANDERRKALTTILFHHTAKDEEFFADSFWRCMSAVHDLTIVNRVRRHYVAFLKQLRQQNTKFFDQLFAGKRMLQALDASGKVQAVQDSDNVFPEFVNQEIFRLPIKPSCSLSSLDLQSSKVMSSATRPMVVPCKPLEKESPYRILLKREDIRMDDAIMNTVRYMRRLLEKNFAVDTGTRALPGEDQRSDAKFCKERDQLEEADRFGIICYKCVPTSNSSGVIEMVPQSTTLDEVRKKYDLPLLQFIRSKNQNNVETDVLRERFMRSTAASCVITYLLGIGDRHLENIMVTRDGHLFHIDFGYVMGDDPKKSLIGSPAMRLTSDMVEALGGLESEYYQRFQSLCTGIFNFLRREYTTIALLLMPLTFIGVCSVADVEREIQSRFVPTESKSQANIQLCNTLNDSRGSVYVPSVVDLMHSGGKHASSLLTEPVMAIVSLIPKSLTTSIRSNPSSASSSSSSIDISTKGKSDGKESNRNQNADDKGNYLRTSGSSGSGSGGNNGGSSNGGKFSGRNSFERETAALGRGVQAPLRSPLGNPSPLYERMERELSANQLQRSQNSTNSYNTLSGTSANTSSNDLLFQPK